ncbi:MAG: hypothetical protein KFB96_20035 [Thiocapsa sp.]|uniref:DUF6776 family protein n=1 Tax=Thiocapsa sp. TaxID=2024551 RepID=UPI001BD0AFA8|nr:DUF6776 family protein [Thiocapsa sp.]QVL47930.1 MAG: hypothetical protein KFB96_20035 [Thiocapsa sp.]
MPESLRRLSYRLLAGGFYAVLLAAALWAGFELGQERVTSLMQPELAAFDAERLDVVAERDALRGALAAAMREQVIAERSRQIDREMARALTDQLKEAQDARLDLNRELLYLKRLVQEGDRGALRVQDLRLVSEGPPKAFRYTFTLTQVVPGFSESTGHIRFEIEGRTPSGAVTLSLADLPSAAPRALPIALEYLQSLSGTFELPGDFEPTGLLIGIEPSDDRLIPTSESFPWAPTIEAPSPGGSLEEALSKPRPERDANFRVSSTFGASTALSGRRGLKFDIF